MSIRYTPLWPQVLRDHPPRRQSTALACLQSWRALQEARASLQVAHSTEMLQPVWQHDTAPTCSLILCQALVSADSRIGMKLLLRQPSLHAPGRAAAPSGKLHLWRQPHRAHANSMLRISCLTGLARTTMPLTVISFPVCHTSTPYTPLPPLPIRVMRCLALRKLATTKSACYRLPRAEASRQAYCVQGVSRTLSITACLGGSCMTQSTQAWRGRVQSSKVP